MNDRANWTLPIVRPATMTVSALTMAAVVIALAGGTKAVAQSDEEARMVAFFFNRKGSERTVCARAREGYWANWEEVEAARGRFVLARTNPGRLTPPGEPPRAYGRTWTDRRVADPGPSSNWSDHGHLSDTAFHFTLKRLTVKSGGHKNLVSRGTSTLRNSLHLPQPDPDNWHYSHRSYRFETLKSDSFAHGNYTVYGTNDMNLPYMPLIVCRQRVSNAITSALPGNSVILVDGKACPSGGPHDRWIPYQPAAGRFIVPRMDAGRSGDVVGRARSPDYDYVGDHGHGGETNVAVNLPSGGLKEDGGGAYTYNYLGQAVSVWISRDFGMTMVGDDSAEYPLRDLRRPDSLVPHVELLPCIKENRQVRVSKPARKLLPPNISIFSAANTCEGDWTTAPASGGFMLLGLPHGGVPIQTVGKALSPGEHPRHSHTVGITMKMDVDATNVPDGTGIPGMAQPTGDKGVLIEAETPLSDEGVVPYILLSHCTLKESVRKALGH